MPARLRITIVFTLLVTVILTIVCSLIYYFSYLSRVSNIQSRLTHRAITIGNLLKQTNFFSNELVRRIDSSTSISYKDEVIQAYDNRNNKIYEYGDPLKNSSVINISNALLNEARAKGKVFFTIGEKEAVAYHYTDSNSDGTMIAIGEDQDGRRNLNNLIEILVYANIGGLIIAALCGYFFSKELLKPIIKIADDVNHISAQNLSELINTGPVKDEWHYLSDTLNALLNRLQDSFNLQKRFIANASHELSTPLTSISSQLEVSLQREREAPEYRTVMKSVHQDVLHMSKLTRTLLEFAKASGTSAGIDLTPVRIDEVLLRLPHEMSKMNHACSLSFEFYELPAEESNLLVFGNEELLFTAIKNIVVNACKYSEKPAIVKLNIEKDVIQIAIHDNGKGIPETELTHIFEPFYRVNDTKTKDGFGLGLSITLKIIKLHNGIIKVSSEVGKGTTFTILLPVAKNAG